MKFRYQFDQEKSVSLIGFGAWQLGNVERWKGSTFKEGIALVKEAVNQGVNFFDTAPNYASGNSEKILGEALKGVRENVMINTKVGHGPNGEYGFTKEAIKASINHSLKTLQTTYLDSVILHNPERYILEGKSELHMVLQDLKEQGIIKKWGVSIDSLEELKIVLDHLEVDTIEIMFNMIHQEPRYLFNEVEKRGIFLIVKVPLDSGWLTGKYDETSTFRGIRARWSEQTITTRADIVKRIKNILKEDNLVAPALQFILSYTAVSTVIPGTKNKQQLQSSVSVLDYHLSKEKIREIESLYETYIKGQDTPW